MGLLSNWSIYYSVSLAHVALDILIDWKAEKYNVFFKPCMD